MDRWQSKTILCDGGLDLSQDALTQGTVNTGTAVKLQNYEASLSGGYSRVQGYSKWDSTVVPGEDEIRGVKVGFSGVFAARGTEVYYSVGLGWTKITSSSRSGSIEKYRFKTYSFATPILVMCDGVNPAGKWDGSSYTLINGSGAPANPKYLEFHLSRLVLSGYSSNPRAISLSAPNSDTTFSGSGAIELNTGDVVVGLKIFRGTLYIFCQNSIKKLTGSSSADFTLVDVTLSIGCAGSDTIQEVGGDLLFLAPDGLRSLAATDKIGDVDLALRSSAIQPIIRGYIGTFTNNNFSSCVIRKKSQYRLFIYDQSSLDITSRYGDAATAIYGSGVYGSRSDDALTEGVIGKLSYGEAGDRYEWSTLLGINVFCTDSEYQDDEEIVIFGHPATGYVYRLESGNDFDGGAVPYIYYTPHLTFDDATLRKVLQKVSIFTQVEGNLDASLSVKLDFEDPFVLQPMMISLAKSINVFTYGSAVYGTGTYTTSNSPVIKKNLVGSGFTAQFQISGADSNPPHRIDSFQIEHSVKGRR